MVLSHALWRCRAQSACLGVTQQEKVVVKSLVIHTSILVAFPQSQSSVIYCSWRFGPGSTRKQVRKRDKQKVCEKSSSLKLYSSLPMTYKRTMPNLWPVFPRLSPFPKANVRACPLAPGRNAELESIQWAGPNGKLEEMQTLTVIPRHYTLTGAHIQL